MSFSPWSKAVAASGGGRGGCAGGRASGNGADRFVGFDAVKIMRGGVGKFGGRAVESDPPVRHPDEPVAIGAREIERMQVAQHSDAVMPIDPLERVHDDARVAGIERTDR